MSSKERKLKEKEARRESILEAAKSVFVEKGLRGSTVDEIASRAELGKGTIYLYFKVKEAIYVALIEKGLALLEERLRSAVDPSLKADANLRRLSEAYYRFYEEEPHYFKLLMYCNLEETKAIVDIKAVEQASLGCLSSVSAVIQKGVREKVFSPKVVAGKAAAVLWAASLGVLFLFGQDQGKGRIFNLDVKELLSIEVELFMKGLRKSDSK